jgi:hypothetical protein
MKFDTNNYTKITEDQFVRFIDKTPTATTPTWVLVAAVEEGGAEISYNPDLERTKIIVNENAISNHKGNDKQMSVPYIAYKNDPCFEFANAGRDKLNYTTHLLEVDIWDEDGGNYTAKYSNATLAVTSYHGDTIEFDIYADGDPVDGKVAMTGNTPTFTPTTSL